jgi:hypothetical protein
MVTILFYKVKMYFHSWWFWHVLCAWILWYASAGKVILTEEQFVPDAIRLPSFPSQILLEFIFQKHRPTPCCLVSDADGIVKYTAEIFRVISLLQEIVSDDKRAQRIYKYLHTQIGLVEIIKQ